MISNIKSVLNNTHILCLQETHLLLYDDFSLKDEFKNYSIYYNNLGKAGGTMIICHKSIHKYYDILNIELGAPAKGRVQAIRLNPVDPVIGKTRYDLPINIINWHLEGDKIAQLEELLSINNKVRAIAGGDCNFVISTEDAPREKSGIIASGGLLKTWGRVVEHFSLSEIHQPTHTHYHIPRDLDFEKIRTSRIDRVYVTMDAADAALFKPIAFIPYVPFNILRIAKAMKNENGTGVKYVCDWVTDHLPVTAQFIRTKNTRATNKLPRWIADESEFIEGMHTRLERELKDVADPFDAFNKFEISLARQTREFVNKTKEKRNKNNSDIASLHICFKALRLLSSSTPRIQKIRELSEKHNFLSDLLPPLDSKPLSDKKLRKYTNELLIKDGHDNYDLENIFDSSLEYLLNNLPPSTKAPRNKGASEEMEEVRANGNLRSGSRVHTLRADSDSPPNSKPERVAGLLKDFWQTLGNARTNSPSNDQIDEYIKDYNITIPNHLKPVLPDIDKIVDCINATNNSCPGPDGIHFALIRPFAHTLAPVILAMITHMASGLPPPPHFNEVLQFYFPKGDSLLAKDTRPISVANAVGRIIAKLMVESITPAASTILRLAQKGFIPGRQISEHVEAVTQRYYSKVTEGKQHFLLLLDTEKAFDSLDHSFIFKTLDKIGCPDWFTNCYKGLLTGIVGTPVVSGPTNVRIKLNRGVKQGCPLSPIIFALCFDILLHKLACTIGHDHEEFAFADDLAISSGNFSTILSCLHIIKTYSKYSGLGINYKKSHILSATKHFYHDTILKKEQGFQDIEFVDKSKYLGVWIGREVTTETVFEGPMAKFKERIYKLRQIIKKFSLQKRVRICNTYLLPIFYYLAQFYIIPWKFIVTIKIELGRVVIPFNGGGFAYAHLVAPKNCGGPYSPLVDLWAMNYALLAQKFDLRPSHGKPYPDLGPLVHCGNEWTEDNDTMLIEEHRAQAAWLYMYDHNPRDMNNNINVGHVTGPPKKMRRAIYYNLVSEGYWQGREAPTFKTSTDRKIKKVIPKTYITGIPKQPHNRINKNMNMVAKHIKAHIWDFRLKFIFRALPTDVRLKEAMQIAETDPCALCGKGPDEQIHTYYECEVTKEALILVNKATKTKIQPVPLHLLLLDPPKPTYLSVIVILHFIWAVWNQRQYYCKALEAPPKLELIAERILDYTLLFLPELGGAGGREGAGPQRAPERLARNPQRDSSIIAFTDGSSLDNPGPSGAGIYFTTPRNRQDRMDLRIALSLGHGDNNWGEMVAIYTALRLIIYFYESGGKEEMSKLPAMLFTDSMGCVCYLTDTWPSPTDTELSRASRAIYQKLIRNYPKFRIYWIKGHSRIEGNDIANDLALDGSKHCKHTGIEDIVRVAPTFIIDEKARAIIKDVTDRNWRPVDGRPGGGA